MRARLKTVRLEGKTTKAQSGVVGDKDFGSGVSDGDGQISKDIITGEHIPGCREHPTCQQTFGEGPVDGVEAVAPRRELDLYFGVSQRPQLAHVQPNAP